MRPVRPVRANVASPTRYMAYADKRHYVKLTPAGRPPGTRAERSSSSRSICTALGGRPSASRTAWRIAGSFHWHRMPSRDYR